MIVAGFDTETTGLKWGDHRFVEVYVGLWNFETREKIWELNQRIDPQRSISADSQRIHGITASDLVGKPVWDAVAPIVTKAFARADFGVAHNAEGFDVPFLNYELERVKQPHISIPVVDTMLQGRWATPIGKVPNLGELCFACDIEYDPEKAHAADYDVDVMMKAFFRAYDWGFIKLPELKTRETEHVA